LVAALLLAVRGVEVTVVDRAATPGGKMRRTMAGGVKVDGGPTVFTLRSVFEDIFAAAGVSLSDHLTLRPASVLARHAWGADERLDLFADLERSADAIGTFAGAREAAGYRAFCDRARRIYDSLETTFIRAQRPSLEALVAAFGLRRLGDLWQISPFVSLWRALGEHFEDPRLRQLFGRYATYCGSSPFLSPATLMLVAHVEREGVWLVDGGMHRLAQALAALAAANGATLRYRCEAREVAVRGGWVTGVVLAAGEFIEADAVVVNADVAAVGAGLLGRGIAGTVPAIPPKARSLSAVTWAMRARTAGFPLLRHNVFFSRDYAGEFDSIRRGALPDEPTVYVCAQARGAADAAEDGGPEPLLCLVNAPATGDITPLSPSEIAQCEQRTFARLAKCGLHIERQSEATVVTTPSDFDRLFPGTGGALYGPASHGWMASFRRTGARCRLPGLYFAGGSTHPGPGVPMAAISGFLAAQALITDLASTSRSRRVATGGGMSTR
jgi:1-hydroxycarotenoid 3,4-desaturase